MTNQSEYTNKEELDWAEQLYIESPSISLKEFRERIKALVATRESALLSRVNTEIIGKDETTSVDGYDIRDNPPYSFRNHLRTEQRTKLDQLKETL